MKTNITPELKQAIEQSVERSKIAVAKLEQAIAEGNYVYAKPYASKPDPAPAYQNMPAYKAKISNLRTVFERSLNNGN